MLEYLSQEPDVWRVVGVMAYAAYGFSQIAVGPNPRDGRPAPRGTLPAGRGGFPAPTRPVKMIKTAGKLRGKIKAYI